MDIGALTQLIGSLGFPIVVAGALFWQNIQISEKHDREMAKITEAVNNNTLALASLTAKLEKEGD